MIVSEPTRYANVAIARLLLTLSIFLFHVFYIYYSLDLEVYLPLSAALQGFNFLSAYLCSRKIIVSWKDYYRRRMTKLIAPALAASLIIILLEFVFAACAGGLSWSSFIACFEGKSANGFGLLSIGTLWYTAAMVAIFALVPFFFLARKKKWIWAILGCIAVIEIISTGFFWQPLVYTPFLLGFVYGFFTGETNFAPGKPKKLWDYWVWPLVALLLSLTLNYGLRSSLGASGASSFFLTLAIRINMVAIGVCFVVFLLRALRFLGTQRVRFLDATDRLSYPFFLIHLMFLCGAYDMAKYIPSIPLAALVSFVLSLAFAIIIHYMTKWLIIKASTPHLPFIEGNNDLIKEEHHEA